VLTDRNMRRFGDKFPARSGNEDLPDKIEISQIGEIARNTCALPPNVSLPMSSLSHDALALSPLPLSSASPLSFSLLSARGEGELGGPRRDGRELVGRLDRRIEHAPQGWTARRYRGDGRICARGHGDWAEDQADRLVWGEG